MKLQYFSPRHRNLGTFASTIPDLTEYWNLRIKSDIKRNLCAGYVLLSDNEDQVIGYFTLSQHAIKTDLNDREKGRYQKAPATLLGRLAVNKEYIGKGYGRRLIESIFWLHIDISKRIGSAALILLPLESAMGFYNRIGLFTEYEEHLYVKTKHIKEFLKDIDEDSIIKLEQCSL